MKACINEAKVTSMPPFVTRWHASLTFTRSQTYNGTSAGCMLRIPQQVWDCLVSCRRMRMKCDIPPLVTMLNFANVRVVNAVTSQRDTENPPGGSTLHWWRSVLPELSTCDLLYLWLLSGWHFSVSLCNQLPGHRCLSYHGYQVP